MTDFDVLRDRMVDSQLKARGITDGAVLDAMSLIPRERFVPRRRRSHAYEDGPLPIGREQTISQPFIVALMAQAAQLKPRARVLDVGFGSGYSAAVLAEMGAEVYAVERQTALARRAGKTLKSLGYTSVRWRVGDGTLGWPEAAPFDAIIVAAAGPVPRSLCDQLMIGGRLIIPVPDDRDRQYLKRIRRTSQGDWSSKTLGGVTFVPLISGEKD